MLAVNGKLTGIVNYTIKIFKVGEGAAIHARDSCALRSFFHRRWMGMDEKGDRYLIYYFIIHVGAVSPKSLIAIDK